VDELGPFTFADDAHFVRDDRDGIHIDVMQSP
jgi:hypothetical protein